MFRRQPPRIDHLIVLGVERTTIGPAMFDALSIMMRSARRGHYEEPARRVLNARHARANPVGYNGSRLLTDDATVAFDSACRARERRDMTVPIGAPVIWAISL
jgi:hypothetical protein